MSTTNAIRLIGRARHGVPLRMDDFHWLARLEDDLPKPEYSMDKMERLMEPI